ncbi:hypothetical protein GCM10011611_07310 [Aliidongia dinghuensis]|uniref:Uncharacterized protein n=1 Tax=Aliidongia dinghuensis TaxID=1867774 RepID=A0A8J3E1U7_9PROT|nr:cupredoxin domain-containing protein [Aliidongia dinghuensis]GGF04442.1 hypothetical protein GCM10011611_07310 [Aliidongia dinghuensis]
MSLRSGLAGVMVAAALAVAPSISGAQAIAKAGEPPTVVMQNLAFGPAPADLKVGETLVFRNDDSFRHTATARGDFDLDLKPGHSGSVVLKRAGTIQVTCRYHPTMKLTLTVAPLPALGDSRQ